MEFWTRNSRLRHVRTTVQRGGEGVEPGAIHGVRCGSEVELDRDRPRRTARWSGVSTPTRLSSPPRCACHCVGPTSRACGLPKTTV
jgi:hypothetical protein